MSDFLRFVERVNAIMGKEPNPQKRKEMQKALLEVESDFNKILKNQIVKDESQCQSHTIKPKRPTHL